MKTLSEEELTTIVGQYFAPKDLYHYTKSLPFLGSLQCDITSLTAGQWTEVVIIYTVGGSGLADGAWMKGTFKFYSDWALFQTSDPKQDNHVSAEYIPGPLKTGQTPATVQSLAVRFDQKGHERPFQKAVIIDIVDGYLNPGDKIVIRLGDRRWGAKGTRVQTFVEDNFLMRWYIDPVGTSRFAAIKPDIAIPILPGPPVNIKAVTPRVVQPGTEFTVHLHAEDHWGNATKDLMNYTANAQITKEGSSDVIWNEQWPFNPSGWTIAKASTTLPVAGDYIFKSSIVNPHGAVIATESQMITSEPSLPVSRPLFADLHVHSDDTVGTNSTTYNFSYAQQIAGLDVVGYTANDFNITKQRWDATLDIIRKVNADGDFVVFPGTEWCGNSAAGGDHNVVFLDDPAASEPEFSFDKHGNVARSFEWNEDGPAKLLPGAWPLDEVYATYAHVPEKHLLIPHVGGRRCNLAWHHPELERLLEIGSAWGLFEWLLRDAVKRGWKLGVCANSDEHRGRCGGGVPGTAVFGTKGGLTGVLSPALHWKDVATTLRARRTFATTGERLVGLVSARHGTALQGDEIAISGNEKLSFKYAFYGNAGFSSVEAWDANGIVFIRDLQQEASTSTKASTPTKLRIEWGGARVYDRYKEAIWHGAILIPGAKISHIVPFGGVSVNPEDSITVKSVDHVVFHTRTSGDFDGVDIFFEADSGLPREVSVTGTLDGYVKVGNALSGNPHKSQPSFNFIATRDELKVKAGKHVSILGGAELYVRAETLLDVRLPRRVEGEIEISNGSHRADEQRAVYFVAREWNGGKVITSPIFVKYNR
ncbi:uncharacterized protein EKO05_0002723 [Ascochyta rabiei]|uniref:uncharacterized protein n=1 Tax=Didymella rabiei TaxID=5454 RepID=UPI00190105D5|nr:uncharacterized protein EKO05_0002723 [Ascochyta rabiei]UPX12156.1 hypothetical protein EKO05_0002723 [Ascochyta rabiei]